MVKSKTKLVKLLHGAAGHIATVELKSTEGYRGSMIECKVTGIVKSKHHFHCKDGKVAHVDHVFIRGSKVSFMIIPGMLKRFNV